MRFFLEISYVGTRYKGWQVQTRAHTVQAEMNDVLSQLFTQEIKTVGCGRTDAGVHARQFFLHFDADKPPIREFMYKINRLLPDDIVVKRFFSVADDARSRQDATSRTYEYHLHLKKDPFLNDSSFYFPYGKPDLSKMQEAATLLKTLKDFKSLSKTDTQEKTSICNIYFSEWKKMHDNQYRYTITADHFLRGMVRLTVGAMLMIGTGKITLDEFQAVMKKRATFKYVLAVPGCGLSLTEVKYPYL